GRGSRANEIVAEGERIARELLGEIIFGADDEQLEQLIVRLLTDRKETLSVAESCTGGFISHRLKHVPRAPGGFFSSLITYSNEAKQKFLGVSEETLAEHGAVSERTACAMAEGARARTESTYGLSVTGIAGPGGGTDAKPVGTVFIGLAGANETVVRHFL